METLISAKQIFKSFGDLQVLKGVDIQVNQGEIISIVGPSGAGKTTLLQILGTLDYPEKNSKTKLIINGKTINGLNDKSIAKFRNEHIGFIFQFHQLLPEFTALENVCIPAYIKGMDKNTAEQKAKDLLDEKSIEEILLQNIK